MDFPWGPPTDAYVTSRLGFRTSNVSAVASGYQLGSRPARSGGDALRRRAADVCLVGEPSTSDGYIIRRYREDLNDGPDGRYNVDTFQAWVGSSPSYLDANRIVIAATTSCNANWCAYERSAVFVQQPHGSDHWLPELPPHVRTPIAHRDE